MWPQRSLQYFLKYSLWFKESIGYLNIEKSLVENELSYTMEVSYSVGYHSVTQDIIKTRTTPCQLVNGILTEIYILLMVYWDRYG